MKALRIAVLIVSMASSAIHKLGSQGVPEGLVPKADSITVSVETDYVYNKAQGLYTYVYRVVNEQNSHQMLSNIALETTGRIVANSAPVAWKFGIFVDRPLVHWYGAIIDPPEQFYIARQQEGIFTLTSPDPPGEAWMYVQGDSDIPKATPETETLTEEYPALFDETLNSKRIKTIAPQAVSAIEVDVEPKTIKLSGGRDSVTVRVYGTDAFNVASVSWEKWAFGPSAGREIHEVAHVADFNKDGRMDVELHFRIGSMGVRVGSDQVCLSAYEERRGWRQGCASINVGD